MAHSAHEHPHPHSHTCGQGTSSGQEASAGYGMSCGRPSPGDAIHVRSVTREGSGAHSVLSSGRGMRVVYVDCFAGVSGDMLLGALVDAGLSLDALKAELDKLQLAGWEITAGRIQHHGLTGTQLTVQDTLQEYPARHVHDIRQLIEGSTLSDAVKAHSTAVIERLGCVEAGIHGVPLEEVHFHEIGAVDTLVDVVGFVAGLELLGVQQVYASAIPLGKGAIQTAHGRLPVPAPATLALLASVGAPTMSHPAQTEIVTPTGAALLTGLAQFERPEMRVEAIGYGFGRKRFKWANGLRVWIGSDTKYPAERKPGATHVHQSALTCTAPAEEFERDEVVILECNLDDSTGETLGYVMERLFDAGALDVWFTPIQMKKNRPGVLLSVLLSADPARISAGELASILMQETSTLGVRLLTPVHRFKADRCTRAVPTPWGEVRVKEKRLGERTLAVSPEYEDCARLAREAGVPLVRVMDAARQAAAPDVRPRDSGPE